MVAQELLRCNNFVVLACEHAGVPAHLAYGGVGNSVRNHEVLDPYVPRQLPEYSQEMVQCTKVHKIVDGLFTLTKPE